MDVELAENGVYESDGPTQEMQNDQSESQESDVEIQIRRRHLRKRLIHTYDSLAMSHSKAGCVFLMDVVSILPDAEFGRNSHREDAPHFSRNPIASLDMNQSLKSVNVNGNDDELDSEEIEIEENPLDESELIQDYQIESLQLYDSGESYLFVPVLQP